MQHHLTYNFCDMTKQIIFILVLMITLGVFAYSANRILKFFRLTKPFPVSNWGERFRVMMKVAIGQTKIFQLPVIGLVHALVFWGFMVITLGSIEMVVDGITGMHRSMAPTGWFYHLVMASGDVMAYVIMVSILIFVFRRIFMTIKRFYGIEMQPKSKIDALIALAIIFFLMVSLAGINLTYVAMHPTDYYGTFPISAKLYPLLFGSVTNLHFLHEALLIIGVMVLLKAARSNQNTV